MDKIENETCPICQEKKLTLIEDEQDIPYFGAVFIFSMVCNGCGYKQADIECADRKEPSKYEFTIKKPDDMRVRVVKSSEGGIKIPQLKMSVDPGVASEGFVSNIEGVLQRFKKILETERDTADDEDVRKHAKNLLKKLWKVECGEAQLKIIIEDPTGNSAIISENAIITKLKGKKQL
ncbi:ZPR1 zinc finger domain-containing protein [Candidatus Woesearchaeota archaeon]|nr:ZPR1 zinc finger domain-containing protein [Candidatus Woesearchaeota archaeon]